MRKILNRFSVWLYKKTFKKDIQSPISILAGYKIMVSDFVPPDCVYMSSGKFKTLEDAFMHEDLIKLK